MIRLLCAFGLASFLLAGCEDVPPRPGASPVIKKMTLNSATLTYIEQGQGAPVVFVHGAFSDYRVWEPQREAIAQRYRYIALTQRYFGTDPWPDKGEQYSFATHAADLTAFIRQLNAGRVFLVGRSYGATLSITVALQHPELVRGVLAQEPSFVRAVTDPAQQKMLGAEAAMNAPTRAAAKAGNAAEATRLFSDWVNGQPGGFDALPPEQRAVHLDNGRTIVLHIATPAFPNVTCSDLGQMKTPLTITTGELSRPFFKILVETAHRCVPGSQVVSIPGGRHGSSSQNPAAFNDALLAFLAKN